MAPSLPVELVSKILLYALSTPSLFLNFTDERHVDYTRGDLVTRDHIYNLPMFEGATTARREISFFDWPVNFQHNIQAYKIYQELVMTGINVSRTFRAILTPMLYRCVMLSRHTQARSLATTLKDTELAALVNTIVICPLPFNRVKHFDLDAITAACVNLQAYHDFAHCHAAAQTVHAIECATSITTLPVRLTHNAFSIGKIKQTDAICDTLVFLEITTPTCHWTGDPTLLEVSLPNLTSLKIEQTGCMLNVMQMCLMPMLQRLCLTPCVHPVSVGRVSAAFLRRHGSRLTQLEISGLLWGDQGVEPSLDALCPALQELIVDPLQYNIVDPRLGAPPINGLPGHPGVRNLGLRNLASATGLARAPLDLDPKVALFLNSNAFPKVKTVRDLAWNPNVIRAEHGWVAISLACALQGVVFRDWAGRMI